MSINEETGKQVPEGEQEKEPTFNEQLDSAIDQNTIQFLQGGLEEAGKRIKFQNEQMQAIQTQQLEFRDEIAVRVFTLFIDKLDSYEQAAVSAYQAADAFLRARESGVNFVEVTEEELN